MGGGGEAFPQGSCAWRCSQGGLSWEGVGSWTEVLFGRFGCLEAGSVRCRQAAWWGVAGVDLKPSTACCLCRFHRSFKFCKPQFIPLQDGDSNTTFFKDLLYKSVPSLNSGIYHRHTPLCEFF